jgi:trk system potassium uptake protein TrkA
MILGSIEQDIPVHELLHLAPLSHEFELVEAQLTVESPAVGRTLLQLQLPSGCSVVALVRDEIAQAVDPDTVFRAGDKVIAAGRAECEPALHGMLIGALPVA